MLTKTAAAALVTCTLVSGCAGSEPASRADDSGSADVVDEISAHDGRVCPLKLPQSEQPFETGEPAASAPTLPVPESAWVCRYDPTDTAPRQDEEGTTYGWTRARAPEPVAEGALPAIAESLTELTPAEAGRMCTADLGPRWMLVYSHGTDLTGVVVDDFGCRSVRLSDEPFEAVPGESTGSGTVPGVLSGPPALLERLRAVFRH